ncbi:uncharacterized protein ACB058_001111 isoform 2-T2 [Synchiropus picturatus]
MPLRCSCLLALLLLPLSLCCSSKNTTQLCNDAVVVKPQLNKTKRDLEHLRNSTCKQQNYTLPSCTLDSRNISTTLGRLTCKMWKIGLDLTEELVESLRYSTSCSCKTNHRKRRSTATRRLCKAHAILKKVDECYQILNVIETNC